MHTKHKQKGFSLLEIGVVLALLAGLSMVLVAKNREQTPIYSDSELLHLADTQLRSFMAANGRLPCVDTNSDGTEDCNATGKGQLPYATLGLNRQLFTSGVSAMRYSVYRNANATSIHDADLAAQGINRYQPLKTDGSALASQVVNNADFCQALANGQSASFALDRTYIQAGAVTGNVAYALAMPGKSDNDDNGSLFDGLNGSNPFGFNSSGAEHNDLYDDHVLSRTFTELQQELQCDLLMTSLSLIARGVETEEGVTDTAKANVIAISLGAALALAGAGLSTADLLMATVDVATAIAKAVEVAGQLVAAIASCVIGVGCTQIPRLIAAAAAAAAAAVLATASFAAALVAQVAQGLATVAYAGTAIAAGVVYDQTKRPEEMDDAINSVNSALTNARTDLSDTEAKLAAAKASQPAIEQDATDSATALTDYLASNGQNPDASGSSVITAFNSASTLQQDVAQLQSAYNDKESSRQRAESTCDSLDPPNANDQSCLDAQTLATQATSAKQALEQKQQALNAAKTQLKTASDNFPVKNGVDTEGNQLFSPCVSVAGCNIASLSNTALQNQQAKADKQAEIDLLESQVTTKRANVADLENSVGAMSCNDQGKVWDADTASCNEAQTASGEPLTVSKGAQNALDQIDARIMSGQ